jgi:hypothetical protein
VRVRDARNCSGVLPRGVRAARVGAGGGGRSAVPLQGKCTAQRNTSRQRSRSRGGLGQHTRMHRDQSKHRANLRSRCRARQAETSSLERADRAMVPGHGICRCDMSWYCHDGTEIGMEMPSGGVRGVGVGGGRRNAPRGLFFTSIFLMSRSPARAGKRRFRLSSALRAHTKAPHKTDLHRKTLVALSRPPGGPGHSALSGRCAKRSGGGQRHSIITC